MLVAPDRSIDCLGLFCPVPILRVREAMKRTSGMGRISCRFTHVYPDGPAPYFTVLAMGADGQQLDQWGAIKSAASDAVLRHGGTITHHHAVGRDHRPWYDRQRPEPRSASHHQSRPGDWSEEEAKT